MVCPQGLKSRSKIVDKAALATFNVNRFLYRTGVLNIGYSLGCKSGPGIVESKNIKPRRTCGEKALQKSQGVCGTNGQKRNELTSSAHPVCY